VVTAVLAGIEDEVSLPWRRFAVAATAHGHNRTFLLLLLGWLLLGTLACGFPLHTSGTCRRCWVRALLGSVLLHDLFAHLFEQVRQPPVQHMLCGLSQKTIADLSDFMASGRFLLQTVVQAQNDDRDGLQDSGNDFTS